MVIQEWYGEVERFLYREARLLDSGEFESWLGLLAPDIHYWMPVVENRAREDANGAYGPERMAYFDDRLPDLKRRVERYCARTAWSENPPTRHVHVISNIEVEPAQRNDEVIAHSVFVNYRNRGERDEDVLFGRRRDILCRQEGSWLLARRRIVIAQNVLLAKNINTFF
ncbi:MAG: 3-phenylpropionate/cinnamic acid dioxygenase subunit beta [Proteobacteria bacterium]|nr:3-phenylpropionate/cinnamic acid dioxygenase subunit beta [Pseudomonadota bacterium]